MPVDHHGAPIAGGVRLGVIGCGSHSQRNILPALRFVPARLVAVCDLDGRRAAAAGEVFGAQRCFADHRRMLDETELDAVLVITSYDDRGRPRYPDLAVEVLMSGRHVWIEKPPAASVDDIDRIADVARARHRHAMVGLKKMFAPANVKAASLLARADFGKPELTRIEYPTAIPMKDQLEQYALGQPVAEAMGFLDHLCHPVSVLLRLRGMPATMTYRRTSSGAGIALFEYPDDTLAEIAFTWGAGGGDGMERTVVVSDRHRHIIVDNNAEVRYHRRWFSGYGDVESCFDGDDGDATLVWRPEFSLGQLYNKGVFLLGYQPELAAFCEAVRGGDRPVHGSMQDAADVTAIFEAFAAGPGPTVELRRRHVSSALRAHRSTYRLPIRTDEGATT